MRKLEIVLWCFAGLGLLLKVLHLPLAGLLIVLSLSLLMPVYFLLSWLLFPQPTRKDQLLGLSLFCGLAFTMTLEGVLFKVQMWPGAGLFNLVGLLLTSIALVLILTMRKARPGLAGYFKGLLYRAVPFTLLGLLIYPVSEGDILRFRHRNDPCAHAVMDSLERTVDPVERRALYERLHTPPEPEVHDQVTP